MCLLRQGARVWCDLARTTSLVSSYASRERLLAKPGAPLASLVGPLWGATLVGVRRGARTGPQSAADQRGSKGNDDE